MYCCCRAPGGGSGNGHRTYFGFRRPASGLQEADSLKVSGAGLTDLEARAPEPFAACGGRQVTSGWAPDRIHCLNSVPFPWDGNFVPWDCKVTPADCACQEGNTTGCIPSNDGLDAGLRPSFPHCGKPMAVAIWWAWARIPFLGLYLTAGAGVAVVWVKLRSFVSVVPPGRVPTLLVRPSPGSAGPLSSVPPGPELASADLELRFVQDVKPTSIPDLELRFVQDLRTHIHRRLRTQIRSKTWNPHPAQTWNSDSSKT